MVALPQQDDSHHYMTETEYLEFEDNTDLKHEYANGRIVAMTGGSLRHNIVTSNTSTTLNNQLKDKDCIVPSNDTRVKVDSERVSYRYPDVTVICGEPEFFDDLVDTITNPIVLIEVLSPSTEIDDRNDKLDEYLRLQSLQEYVLISQNQAKIERFLRHESGEWRYTKAQGIETSLHLESIKCDLVLSDIYLKVTFEDDMD